MKTILDSQPHLKADLNKRYIRTVQYLILGQIELQEFKAARENIKLMRALKDNDGFDGIDIRVQTFTFSYVSELRLLERMGEHAKAVELVPAVLQGMEDLGTRLNKEYEIEFWYNLAVVHFGAGEVNKSLFWLNKVLNDPEPTLRQDIFAYARLFNLVVHYELGNYDLLEYIVRSTHRFLSKRHRALEVENALIDHIKKLARATQPSVKRDLFKSLHDELVRLFKDPNQSLVLKYFDFLCWARSKMDGISYSDAVRAGLKKA